MRKARTLIAALLLALAAANASAQSPQKQPVQPAAAAPQATRQQPAQPAASPQTAQAPQPAPPQESHEYAPLLEKPIAYKDWTLKSLKDGSQVNLREWSKGKKLVMVVYFAPWCGNWRLEAPVAARLYEKYKKDGFDVIGVSEYASADDARKYFETIGGAPFAVVVESEARDARDKTAHYAFRQAAGDTRKWGSPFNVFLEPSKLSKTGEVLMEKTWVVGGELIEQDAERFIRERLGLAENASTEPCEDKKQ